ncbi:MAG: adenylate/guanylate cyclase domain-containing protein [Pseudomonadota bacterium]
MSASQPALLVVDDNEMNRYTLTRRLKRDGYEDIAEAENGRHALEQLRARPFDLVLLDITMPELSGYDVLEQLKADMALRDIPVIMISALDEIESVVRCIELGAEDYLPKPFDAVLLKARVGASLEKKWLKDQEEGYRQQIEDEKRRADQLLHAILPAAAVHELKTKNEVTPRRFDEIAVLFCDVVNFTSYCDQHAPEDVVSHLQALVEKFELIAKAHGLEKIKTVGDAFLATAGMFQDSWEPVLASVRCGLDMVDATNELDSGWDVRVGIHFGPVVAGVVGRRQFGFDIWGDTVNIAARIVSEADPGSVLVSGTAWQHLRAHCRGKSKGFVPLKGKGSVELVVCEALV